MEIQGQFQLVYISITFQSRPIHIKRCAKKLEVSGPTLQERVHQQEEEYKLKLVAGVLSEEKTTNNRYISYNRFILIM